MFVRTVPPQGRRLANGGGERRDCCGVNTASTAKWQQAGRGVRPALIWLEQLRLCRVTEEE